MRRREFITLVGGTAVWPLAARAQQPAMPVVGFLHSGSPETITGLIAAFSQGMNEAGFAADKNVTIEYRWAQGQLDRLPTLAADLVSHRVAAIFASGGAAVPLAAKNVTTTVPVVFVTGSDPVKVGLVASLNRPGGNVTGVSFLTGMLESKRLEFLHELVPGAGVIAVLENPKAATAEFRLPEMQAAARALGVQVQMLAASTVGEIESAYAKLGQQWVGALLISSDPLFVAQHEKLIALSARNAVPTIFGSRESAIAGGLFSYGASIDDAYRLGGVYVGRILQGAKPADLPVQQAVKVELVLNLKTAKMLGLTVPPALLARADQVIE